MGTLCAQLLLQFNTDSLETLQINFCHFFRNLNSHFSGILTMKVNGQWVPSVRNSSYSLKPILLKLYRCCDHALKICILFGYNPQIFYVSPRQGRETYCFSPCVCPSIRLSVCLSVRHKSCPLYNLKTVKGF